MGCVGAAAFFYRGEWVLGCVRPDARNIILRLIETWKNQGTRMQEDNDAITTDKEHDVSRQTNVVTKTMPPSDWFAFDLVGEPATLSWQIALDVLLEEKELMPLDFFSAPDYINKPN